MRRVYSNNKRKEYAQEIDISDDLQKEREMF